MERAGFDRRVFLKGMSMATAAAAVTGFTDARTAVAATGGTRPAVAGFDASWATRWVRTVYDVVWAEGLTPPAAARAYAAVAIALYESVVAGMPAHVSTAGQLSGLAKLPRPRNRNQTDWPLAAAAAVDTVAAALFATATEPSHALLDRAYDDALAARRQAGVGAAVEAESLRHGRAVGHALVSWLDTDGYAGTVGRAYTPPVGDALWVSTPPNFGTAIEPHWAEVRPLVMRRATEVVPAPHAPFSSAANSAFWKQAKATYDQSFANTDEHRAIARFWTDNPRLSGLPAGHWMLICAQVAEQRGLDLGATAEAFARLGVAVQEAFLSCWTWKYRLNLLRPVTYVRRYIDSAWSTFVNTPQFPEYTSGHSVASRAASTVLTHLLGSFAFVDDSHRDRNLPARSFASFTAAADEAAQSRLYGGIHFPMGIENGKAQGDEVGALVIRRLQTRRR